VAVGKAERVRNLNTPRLVLGRIAPPHMNVGMKLGIDDFGGDT
jgi:hypothetical protein